ncbi:MAG: hypothetical protein HJJLKODD_01483 [Phycisphaerae bacterium]|nr:hypothetical protein [Phycisphaerae bacterium]
MIGCWLVMASSAVAQDAAGEKDSSKSSSTFTETTRTQTVAAINRAMDFLKNTQGLDGSWSHQEHPDPAITALVAQCFMQHPDYGPDHPLVHKAMDFILTFQRPDGGIYPEQAGLPNYYTSVCLMALSSCKAEKYRQHIPAAQKFLTQSQWDESESIDPDNVWYGGAGYGHGKRPDLSNTQMMIEALKQSGLSPDDPAYKKAIKFIERCQMSSAVNDQPFARGASDGGFIYSPANGGESKAGTLEDGDQPRLRSYGSMTYSGFKSYLYAGLSKDDPRVQAAWQWIQKNYTLDSNPNMPGSHSLEGLYYYFQVFSKALYHWGQADITTPDQQNHNWREDLCHKLVSLQNSDGSWVNTADRWYEGNPYLVTAYSVSALQTALQAP